MRGTGILLAALAASLAGAGGAEDPPRWRLAPGEFAEYSHFAVTVDVKTIERKRGKESPLGVFGHRVVEGRSPRPLYPELANLGRIYALTLPPAADGGREQTVFSTLTDCGPVEVAGKWTAERREDGKVASTGAFDLRQRGPTKSDDFKRILVDGTLAVSSVFDPARGVVEEATFDLRARTVPDEGPVKDRKLAEVKRSGDLVLRRVRVARDAVFEKEVDAAIAKGTAWLLAQPKDGAWTLYPDYPGGIEGLAALALYACDPDRKAGDGPLAAAMAVEPTRTYEAAVTMLAIDMKRTPPGEAALLRAGKIDRPRRDLDAAERAWMEKGAKFLLETAVGPGKWNYPSKQHGSRFVPPPPDLSNSQYGILGLLAAHRCGVAIEEGAWLGALRAFVGAQEKDGPPASGWFPSEREVREAAGGAKGPGEGSGGTKGPGDAGASGAGTAAAMKVRVRGWPYRSGEDSSGSMTCAGIASVAICRDVLREGGGKRLPPDLAADADRAVMDGFAWLSARWTVEEAPHASGHPAKWLHYHLYALERAGILADVARLDGHDWYGDGALHLLLTQDPEGWWTEEPGSVPRKLADTCFALLFLKRAVTPVSSR